MRLYPSGRRTYAVQCRGPKGLRRVTVGQHGEVSPDEARKRAAAIIDRIKAGENPLPEVPETVAEPTVADLAERYLRMHVAVQCKASSKSRYDQLLRHHILPALREMPVGSVERKHVVALHYTLRERPGTANAVSWVLSKMFSLAGDWGLRPAGRNPCRTVRRYKIHYRERFLNREEYRRIGRALCEAEARGKPWPPAVPAIRLLMLTGCRSMEIATLRWDDVDRSAGELRLRDTKTGARMGTIVRNFSGRTVKNL